MASARGTFQWGHAPHGARVRKNKCNARESGRSRRARPARVAFSLHVHTYTPFFLHQAKHLLNILQMLIRTKTDTDDCVKHAGYANTLSLFNIKSMQKICND